MRFPFSKNSLSEKNKCQGPATLGQTIRKGYQWDVKGSITRKRAAGTVLKILPEYSTSNSVVYRRPAESQPAIRRNDTVLTDFMVCVGGRSHTKINLFLKVKLAKFRS